MTKEEKRVAIENLTEQFASSNIFYITDSSTLTVAQINKLRRICFEKGVQFTVAKNTLIRKALEANEGDYTELYDSLKGPSALMFSEVSNLPAKIIKDFRKGSEKPVLKAAYIDSDVFIGEESLETLSTLKSKEELIGEIIGLLQSPAKNVISALQSGGQKLSGILKTLSDKPE